VLVRDPDTGTSTSPGSSPEQRQALPRGRPTAGVAYLPLEELIGAHLQQLFPASRSSGHHPFRVTRNADVEVEEDRDEDLLQALERELARRRFGPAVRLEVVDDMDPHVLDLLVRELEITDDDVSRVPGLLDLASLWQLYDATGPTSSRTRSCRPRTRGWPRARRPRHLRRAARGRRAGAPPVRLVRHQRAALHRAGRPADPHVLAIKQTLYRTSGDSPIVDALVDAAQAGKQVVVLVEITARFDEQANIRWARELEKAGCHVVYGPGRAQDALQDLAGRAPGEGASCAATPTSARQLQPQDRAHVRGLRLLTADPEVGADLTDLFNTLTGYSRQTSYRTLMVAPHGVRAGLVERIRRRPSTPAPAARRGCASRRTASSTSRRSTRSTSPAGPGVKVELVVRGICALRPACPACPRTSRCAASWAASWSTRASWSSAPATAWSTGWAAPT
jgi:polyphosphate kinase